MARTLRFFCLFLLVLGIVFRGVHLGKKVYWHDEVYTSMEMTAHSRSELVQTLFTSQEVRREQLLAFQQFDPDRTLAQLWTTLGREDPQHPPCFYILGWYWIQVFGDSPVAVRSLAVVFGVLALGAMYWLCQELFHDSSTRWIAVGLMAVSPFHVLYAQEAREYSLHTALILVSSTLLLRSLRLATWQSWAWYALSLVIGLYNALFMGLVAIAHGVYVALNGGIHWRPLRLHRGAIAYLLAGTFALLAFAPWLWFLFSSAEIVKGSTAWASVSLPLDLSLKLQGLNFSRLWLDFDWNGESGWVLAWMLPVLLLEVYALGFTARNATYSQWTFVLLLTFVPLLILGLPDVLSGGQRSLVTRYLFPSFLGVQLAVAFLISQSIQALQRSKQLAGASVGLALATIGWASIVISSQADTWWNKVVSYHHPAIAQILNNSEHALLLTDSYGINPGNVISLSYLTNPNTTYFLVPEVGQFPEVPELTLQNKRLFLLNLPEPYRQKLSKAYAGNLNQVEHEFWLLKQK